ncbi:MAG TPA: thiosulfate oxidation carrier complex protein SoxZ [Acetobacteraceae bacterium]|nr:thiosulfate oxidation carrier complex protein SoxZ [Acetobacteraceae bacterium]
MARVLLNVKKTAQPGEIVEVKLLISHPMESGQRKDETGQTVPRKIIHDFRCTYNGEEVLHLDLFPAIAANPYLAFSLRAAKSGAVEMNWVDDEGVAGSASAQIEVG